MAPAQQPRFELRLRAAGIVLGFAAAVWGSNALMDALGYSALESAYTRPVASTIYAYASLDERPDVTVMGSSRVQFGLHAGVLEETLAEELDREVDVFKLSAGGMRPYFLSRLIEDAVLPAPPRELLVIGLEERYFMRPVVDSEFLTEGRRNKDGLTNGDELAGEWDRDEAMAESIDILHGVKNLWFFPWMLDPMVADETAFMRENGGEFMTLDRRLRHDERYRRASSQRAEPKPFTARGTRWTWTRDNADRAGFERILDLVDELDCQVVFVRMPINPRFGRAELMEQDERFNEEIVSRVLERGHLYVNMNLWWGLVEEDDWLDRDHLYWSGCAKASGELATRVLAPVLDGRAPVTEGVQGGAE